MPTNVQDEKGRNKRISEAMFSEFWIITALEQNFPVNGINY
jgi:hypothetical protein